MDGLEGHTGSWGEGDSALWLSWSHAFVPYQAEQHATVASLLPRTGAARWLELACGGGRLAETLLQHNPDATVVGLDGSATMRDAARARLAHVGRRFEAHPFALESAAWRRGAWDAVLCSLSLHHLVDEDKQRFFHDVTRMLRPGSLLAIADLVQPTTEAGRALASTAWDDAVRAQGADAFEAFQAARWNWFRYGAPDDGDYPAPLAAQLAWLAEAGLVGVDVWWVRAGHALFGGWRA